MITVHAIYASTSGNTELVIETIAELWRNQGVTIELHRAEITSLDVITQNQLFMFGASTWDHGILNPYFVPLYEAMVEIDCHGKAAFFIGSGDVRYEPVKFNTGIQMILDRWKERGGAELLHPLKLNGDPTLSMDNLIKPWANRALPVVKEYQQQQGHHE